MAWIFGSSRSGSTWLLRMLGDHGDVVPLNEPHIGHHLGIWRPIPLAWATAEEPPELTTLTDVKRERPDYFFSDRFADVWRPALKEFILTRFGAHLAEATSDDRAEEPRLVIQEPGGSHVADMIMSIFPRASLVFLLRDGRDVVDSWLDAYRRGTWAEREGAYPLSTLGRLAFVRWQSEVWLYRTEATMRAFERHNAKRRVLVRYEDLQKDPARELQRICAMLDLPRPQRMLRGIAEAHAYENVPPEERGAGSETRWAEPGRWREGMKADEIAVMNEVMGEKLVELGYEGRRGLSRLLAA
jgi:hypothetical protein